MISIVIPCYNYARFLPDAIESGLRQKQDGLTVEVLVINDGSTDDTAAVAARYGTDLRLITQPNAGLSAARNTGMREAAFDHVIFLDADDLLAPQAAHRLWTAFERMTPRPAVLGGLALPIDARGAPLVPRLDQTGAIEDLPARLLVIRSRFAPGVLADRRVLLGLGGFDASLRASEDRDMWIRVAAKHRVACLNEVVLHKRDHGSNMSRAAEQQTRSMRQVLDKAFANPALHLSLEDRRIADAVFWYQSSLMYAEAGDRTMAARQMLRSLIAKPGFLGADSAIVRFGRLRALIGAFRPRRKAGA